MKRAQDAGPAPERSGWQANGADVAGELIVRQAQALGLSITGLAQRAGITRSHLYRLMTGEVRDPSLATLYRLATVLKIAPMALFRQYLRLSEMPRALAATSVVASHRLPEDAVAFSADVTVPDHAFIVPGERFTKIWEIQNVGTVPWHGRRMVRADQEVVIARRIAGRLEPMLDAHLRAAAHEVMLPLVEPGMTVQVAMAFTAPLENCTAASLWRMQDAQGQACFPPPFFLQAIVTVVAV